MKEVSCAIYGAGSLGTVLGAYITKNGGKIDLINRNKAHVAALNEKGAVIKGTVNMTVPVTAITPDQMSKKYDVIFLMTKQLFNTEVATKLKELKANRIFVCTSFGLFCNGFNEHLSYNFCCTHRFGYDVPCR